MHGDMHRAVQGAAVASRVSVLAIDQGRVKNNVVAQRRCLLGGASHSYCGEHTLCVQIMRVLLPTSADVMLGHVYGALLVAELVLR